MKKILAICLVFALALPLFACGKSADEATGAADSASSEQALTQGNEENVQSDVQMDETASADTPESAGEIVATLDGAPEGFPKSMPIYSGASILEAGEYGDAGFTMIYMAPASYDDVVSFYQKAFPGVEKEYDEPDECYFENFDIDGESVHVNGLTITDDEDYTIVYITLKYN